MMRQLFFPGFAFVSPVLTRLMHKSLEASQGIGLLLSVIGHVEDREIVILFAISF
jgi:hypothetical protein